IALPASGSIAATMPAQQESGNLMGSGTVLFADDEGALRLVARRALERNGYQVILAENGAAAVQAFRHQHDEIALAVLDKTMPVMGGAEALMEMQKIDSEVPIIISSGYSQAEPPKSATFL